MVINLKLCYLILLLLGVIFLFRISNLINLNLKNVAITKFEINKKNNSDFKLEELIDVDKEKINKEEPTLSLDKKEIMFLKEDIIVYFKKL